MLPAVMFDRATTAPTHRRVFGVLRTAAILAVFAFLALAEAAQSEDLPSAELRALRYYVEQGDMRSARAEVNRLMALHPNWTPPSTLEDITRTAPGAGAGPGDEADRVWKLMEIGNFTAARGRLEALQASYPDWTPPAEMTRLLTVGEAQASFDSAVTRGDAQAAIAAARTAPAILRCDRVNNAWELAVMQRKLGDDRGALGTYRGVAGSCTDGAVLLATLEKADTVASTDDLRQLATTIRSRQPALASRVDQTEQRLLAGRGASTKPQATTRTATAPTAAPAAPKPSATPAPVATATRAPATRRPAGALPAKGDPRVATTQAAARAGDWQGCLARSRAPRSIDLLYERAWCAYNQDRPLEALAAFKVASTAPLGATVQRDARFGMILSFLDNSMTEDAARLSAATPLTTEQRVQVETVILDQRGVRAYQKGEYAQAINYFNALEEVSGSIRRDLAILRAYAYLNAGDRPTAKVEFQRLHDQLATSETRKGLSAAIR